MVGTLMGIELVTFAATALMRLNLHILAPSVSRKPCNINVPVELYTDTSSLVKVTEQPASQNTPMLRRLFANVGMMRPASVPGGKLGKSSDAVVDECRRSPLAMLTVIGYALWLMFLIGAVGIR